ncbi:class I SAM-dependent methyltransferase [Aestuariivivens sediminicola]|uniref:class I SAM-dependent methyltransferase n=1 Tax=Aestuariivivens sediminicola TaxID=2913560 RepID=UPI001F5A6B97|nr:class I SAM-dependent methyltransferase [Aestuariivivens sediminicola]
MLTIEKYYPDWRDLYIHESSPGIRGHSLKLKTQCKNYLESQYYPDASWGSMVNGARNEDLEKQTFYDNAFDLVITADVLEHVYEPSKVFKEIHRTLKSGGAHIFSVPLINKHKPTQIWAIKGVDGEPKFLFEPEWHGNPIDSKGSPVTMHWGYDIVDYIREHTRAEPHIEYIDNLQYGIRAEYIEIIVAKKENT